MSRVAISAATAVCGLAVLAVAWIVLSTESEDDVPRLASAAKRSSTSRERVEHLERSHSAAPTEIDERDLSQGGLDQLIATLRAARANNDDARLAIAVAELRAWPTEEVAALVSRIVTEIVDRPQPRVVDLIGDAIRAVAACAEDPGLALDSLAVCASDLHRPETDRQYETDVHRYFGLVEALCDGRGEQLRGFETLLKDRSRNLSVVRLALIRTIGGLRALQYADQLRGIVRDRSEHEQIRVAAARALSGMGTTTDVWTTLSAITDGVSPENKMQLLLSAARHAEYELAYGMIRDLVQRDADLTENEFMLAMLTMRDAHSERDAGRFAQFMWSQIEVELDDDSVIAARLVTALATGASGRYLDSLRDIEGVQTRLRSIAMDPGANELLAIGAACSWMSLETQADEALAFVAQAERPSVRGFALAHLKSVLLRLESDDARDAFRRAAVEHVAEALAQRDDERLLAGGVHAAAGLGLVDVAPAIQAVSNDESLADRTRSLAQETLVGLSADLRED